MKTSPSRCLLATLIMLLAAPAMAQLAVAPKAVDPQAQEQALALIEKARAALQADQYVAAGEAVESALRLNVFEDLAPTIQHRAFLLAAFAASGREDFLGAHEFMMAATEYPDATPAHWMLRLRFAWAVEAWPDAGFAIATVASRWPEEIRKPENREVIGFVTAKLSREDRLHREYLELLKALFAARYTTEFGLEPDGFWQDLVLDALDHQDLPRAREFATRLENTDTLIRMRIDKRFDALVKSDARRFDIKAAMKRRTQRLVQVTSSEPRNLRAVVLYLYALLDEGRYSQVLKLSEAALDRVAKAPPDAAAFDGLDDSLNWIYNHKAAAQRALGHWDEALATMQTGRLKTEKGQVNVSQAINLGAHHIDAGQPQKALDALADVDWSRGLSPYGRMQLQHVRYRAYLQLDRQAEARDVFAYLRENHKDAEDTWLLVLMDSGDLDAAAEVLIAQLRDVKRRGAALSEAQLYRRPPMLPRMREAVARREALLARADVHAVLEEVGRREKQPVYRTPD